MKVKTKKYTILLPVNVKERQWTHLLTESCLDIGWQKLSNAGIHIYQNDAFRYAMPSSSIKAKDSNKEGKAPQIESTKQDHQEHL